MVRHSFVPSSNFVRLHATQSGLALQTASVSLRLSDPHSRATFELDLFSTVHLAEPAFFTGLIADAADADRVLYELLADEASVARDEASNRRLCVPLRAAPALAQLARNHGLSCQVSELDAVCRGDPRWVLADTSREALARRRAQEGGPSLASPLWRLLNAGPGAQRRSAGASALRSLVTSLPF